MKGPALLVPNAVALIGRTLPPGRKRMIGFACFGGCGPIGATFGAVFSALVADLLWWPWNFWILALVCGVVATLAFYILPSDNVRHENDSKFNATFDYWGTITGITGLILINLGYLFSSTV